MAHAIRFEGSTYDITGLSLPTGFDSTEQLTSLQAGQAYAISRAEGGDTAAADRAVPFISRIESCDPPHPECYVLTYEDGSAYVRDNGGDEVWADFTDYLSHHDLEVAAGALVAR